MKITITPTGGSSFVLGDDAIGLIMNPTAGSGAGGQIKEGFVNQQKRRVQHCPLFRAGYALAIPRSNLENRFAFTVQRSFLTLEACVAFIAFHPDSLPTQGEITLSCMSSTGLILRYLPGAVLESVMCQRQIGLGCDFHYTVAGNGPWQTNQ